MRLRTRFLLVLAILSASVIVSAEILARIELTKAAKLTDSEEAREASSRGLTVLKEDIDGLSGTALDWATWDDSYAFMADRAPHFLSVNLVRNTFDYLRIDVLAFYDTNRHMVASGNLTNDDLRMDGVPPGFARLIDQPLGLIDLAARQVAAGFAVSGDDIWMVAAAPILDSRSEGPSRGTLIMGRRVDRRELRRFGKIIQPSFQLVSASPAWPSGAVEVVELNSTTLRTRTAMADVFGTGRVAMSLDFPRTDYIQIRTTLAYLSVWIIVFGVGVWLLAVWLLNRWVLRTITESVEALRTGVAASATCEAVTPPLRKAHDDELGELADAIEAAIGAVKASASEADRRRTEAIHSQRLAALGTMAAGVAHEINNPNGAISLNLNVLRRELRRLLAAVMTGNGGVGRSREPADAHVRIAKEMDDIIGETLLASDRISGIVSSLKRFARPADRAEKECVAIPDLIAEAERWVRHAFRQAQCRLEPVFDPGLPRVTVNRQQVVQVFVNLLQNACQAATHPETVVRVSGSAAREEGVVRIAVADEGKGMPPEDVEHALDPFFTTRQGEGGTGLGLSIAAAIVKAHGGSLRIDSRDGAGTVVTVALPIEENADEQ